jgi:hypothetical protein
VAAVELNVGTWAEQQFASCDLGDRRRTGRVVKMAAQFAADPSGSTPAQTENWSDCKAAYRLFDSEDVTFASLATPHWQATRARQPGHYLLIGDTTVVSFGAKRKISGLNPVGDGPHLGFLLHSALMVDPKTEEVFGLAAQTIHHRQKVPKGETFRERLARDRESRVWGDVIELVGPPPEGTTFTHVFDRGADNFEVYCRLVLNRDHWVVRAAQLRRNIVTPNGTTEQLGKYVDSLPVSGTYDLEVRANTKQPARTAKVEVRVGSLQMPAPRDCGHFVRECGIATIDMNVVEVREVNPPKGVAPLRWVLLTSHRVASFDEAWEIIGYYEKRPLVEEFHKSLKTGCRLEDRQYQAAHRLEALTAVLSVVAIRLLQLRSVARTNPDRPAEQLVPARWIKMLACCSKGKARQIRTVRDFYRGMASLGGFLGRKHDGEPGWITLWRGFEKLHLLLRGAEAYNKKCG